MKGRQLALGPKRRNDREVATVECDYLGKRKGQVRGVGGNVLFILRRAVEAFVAGCTAIVYDDDDSYVWSTPPNGTHPQPHSLPAWCV